MKNLSDFVRRRNVTNALTTRVDYSLESYNIAFFYSRQY